MFPRSVRVFVLMLSQVSTPRALRCIAGRTSEGSLSPQTLHNQTTVTPLRLSPVPGTDEGVDHAEIDEARGHGL